MPFSWIGGTAAMTGRRGLRVEPLLRDAGIGEGREGPISGLWLDPAEYMLMCGLVIEAVEDEMHDTTRSRMRLGTASLGVKLVATSRTLGAAIDTLVRFFDVAGTYCLLSKSRLDEDLLLTIQVDVEDRRLAALVEEMTATYLQAVFSYFLGELLPFAAFYTPASAHPHLGDVHPYLWCPVRVGPASALRIAVRHLARPAGPQALKASFVDALVFWVLQHADAPEADDAAPGGLLGARLYDHLLAGDAPFEACSEALGLAPRDLRLGLLAEGATYRGIRRAALLARARRLLIPGANAEDIAPALGYSDARSLRRAIRLAGGPPIARFRQPAETESVGTTTVLDNIRRIYTLTA